ncbi:FAD-dependent oxidoreductase [Microvirga sp. M2]|uniref:FAD-dependent oxidoreductase n=1 Tax=Microvirga sp. M2 TaxID=3073270 RepID=UPI0039C21198
MTELSGKPDCCWVANAPKTDFPQLAGTQECDVAIVGAGIVGLTTALSLLEAGRSVVVLEARQVGRQVTGRSSAKITAQHSLIYRDLIDTAGSDIARAYAEANRTAMAHIRERVGTLRIDCDFEPKSAFTYTCDPGRREDIRAEAEAATALGFDVRVVDEAPLPFATAGALEFRDQAQFNPARYLVGLAAAVQARGGRIYERSRATRFDRPGRWSVGTAQGQVMADHVVVATNITVKSPVGYANRTQPRCHVVMAFRTDHPEAVDGMFISIDDPTHSIRTGRDADGPLILTLGPRFNTGQDGDVARRFRELEDWTRANLPVGEAAWRWCNEDYDTPDRMPYVGQPDAGESPGFHVATGFNGWGISNGTAAGLTVAHEIATGSRPWGPLYRPDRPAPKDFHQNGDTQSLVDDVARIAPGEGGVIVRGDEKIAVWRDEGGGLHALSASCTHKGCTVTWNNADRTWDCPCHGSMFERNGAVIHGPAREPLPPREI